MKGKKAWHEQDRFWDRLKPHMFTTSKVGNAPEEAKKFILLLKIPSKKHILDLCCGVGRHSIALARQGFKVTGVDRTESYLKEARKKAKGLKIEFIQEDMRKFCRPDAFNVAICMFTSFGFFDDQKDDRKVIENVYKSLKSKGRFLIDVMGKEVLARIFKERMWSKEENGVIFLQEHKIIENWEKIKNRWIAMKGDKKIEFKFSHRIYSAVELSNLLKECGFKKVEVYGNLEGAPYDHKAERLLIVGEK